MSYVPDWDIAGHAWAVGHLTRALNAGRLRHAYLISGPAGIGKTTFARAFARAVNCVAEGDRPCGVCRPCRLIARDAHADVTLVQAAEGKLKIEQVRDMVQTLSLRPVEARYRVVILRAFNEASPNAMDALLKTLEEPPDYVLLLLTADTTDSLLPTIRSRCQPINLRPLAPAEVRTALIARWNIGQEQAALLGQLSGGRLGWAVRAAQNPDLQTQRAASIADLERVLGENRIGRFALADSLSRDKDNLTATLELWLSYWRDVLLLTHGAATPITNRDRRHALEQIAGAISAVESYRVVQAVRRTLRYIAQNVNARLALEVLTLDLPRVRLFDPPSGG